jgi:hypothetical protein
MENSVLDIFVGLAVLTTGRKLFWLFVGLIGFAAGFHFGPQIWPAGSKLVVMLLAVATGIVGAVLAVFFQQLAVVLAGFAAGSYLVVHLLTLFEGQTNQLLWLPYLIGGVLGAVLAFALFDWALIVLSACVGASLVVQGLHYSLQVEKILFLVLAALGVAFQVSVLSMEKKDRSTGGT